MPVDVANLTADPWGVAKFDTCACDLGHEAFAVTEPPVYFEHPDVDAVDTHPLARFLHAKEVSGILALAIKKKADAEFMVMARAAFKVMMDNRVHPEWFGDHWGVRTLRCQHVRGDDPFDALLAYKSLKESGGA